MANQAQQLQDALNQHDRVRKSTDLPLFYGKRDKEAISANVLIDRLEHAARIAGWNTDERKCTELYMILRDKALVWWESLPDTDVNRENWNEVKANFLRTYAPKFTARTTCTNFQELVQKQGEAVHDYYLRVTESFRHMCEAKPAVINDVRAERGTATAEQATAIKKEGIVDTERFFKHQLFIAGLKEDIRLKVMEAGKTTLKDTLELACELEVIMNDKHKLRGGIASVEAENDESSDEAPALSEEEISAINLVRAQQGKPPFRFFRRNQDRRQTGNSSSKPDNRKCRYCHTAGHMQQKCRKRIAAGAPCVDENGKPWAKQPGKVNQVSQKPHRQAPPPPPSYGTAATVTGASTGFTGGYDPYSLNWC